MPGAERPFGPRAATALLLVEGYCALAVEMIALRALVPVAGQSVAVTSLVVTAFLAALALGYRAGGAFEGDATGEGGAEPLAAAAAWSALWLSRFGVALAFEATGALPPARPGRGVRGARGRPGGLPARASGGAPGRERGPGDRARQGRRRVRREHARQRRRGARDRARGDAARGRRRGGGARGGAPRGGGARGGGERPGWRLWAAAVVVAGVAGANLAVERSAYVTTTAHADYAIEADTDGARRLRVNGQNASREDGAGTGHPYVEWIEDRVYAAAPAGRPARVLVIRCWGIHPRARKARGRSRRRVRRRGPAPRSGGGRVPRARPPPRALRGRWTAGRTCCATTKRSTRSCSMRTPDRTAVPAHLLTREFFALARSRLSKNGTPVRDPHRRPGARPAVHARGPHAALRCSPGAGRRSWGRHPDGAIACTRARGPALDGDATVYSDATGRADTDAVAGGALTGGAQPASGRYTRDPWAGVAGEAVGKGKAALNRRSACFSGPLAFVRPCARPLVPLLETRVRCGVRVAVCRRASR